MACSSAPEESAPPSDTSLQRTQLTYHQDIQPIYEKHCGFCHAGCSPDGCAGGTCFVSYYEALLYPAPVCHGDMNMAECGLYRIEFTQNVNAPDSVKLTDKDNKLIIVSPEEINTIAQWIQQGMPIGTPPPPIPDSCVPDCTGKACGCDGCGGLCEDTCELGIYCHHASGQCSIGSELLDNHRRNNNKPPDACTPFCDYNVCGGPDGCGNECPITCAGTCNPETNKCEDCSPQCEGILCGSDRCGDLCPYLCEDLECDREENQCIPEGP